MPILLLFRNSIHLERVGYHNDPKDVGLMLTDRAVGSNMG